VETSSPVRWQAVMVSLIHRKFDRIDVELDGELIHRGFEGVDIGNPGGGAHEARRIAVRMHDVDLGLHRAESNKGAPTTYGSGREEISHLQAIADEFPVARSSIRKPVGHACAFCCAPDGGFVREDLTRAAAEAAINSVSPTKYGAKYDKAVACLTKDRGCSARLLRLPR